MKRLLLLALALASFAPAAAGAAGFQKPYFGATKAGAFARQKATDEKGAVTEYTYSRLADVGTDRVIEMRYAVVSGQFKGDRYGYEYKGAYINAPATTTGDLWLSDAVPFGLVKDVMTIRDGSGKTLTRIETVLVESGEGARTAMPRWSWSGPAKRRTTPARKPRR